MSDSDGDEFQKQLDRLSKLEADVNNITENSSPTSDNESEDWSRKAFSGGKRVTRNATGSLPKETKTLLMETTEAFDPNKSRKRPPSKPGHFHAIAPECTACGSDVILRPYQRRMLIHPYLKTAVCRQCHEFYHSDAFGVDDEGSQIYCVWCGEGGELIYCDKCEKAFCTDCIKRNFGKKVKEKILQESNWECFLCNNHPIQKLQKIAGMIVGYQNLCIRDPYLVEKFECEVTKADMQKDDYQSHVSARIQERNVAKLLSSSQQEEEVLKNPASSDGDQNETNDEDNNDQDSNQSSSSDSDYSAGKIPKKQKLDGKKASINGNSTQAASSSDSDEEKFLEAIRSKAKDPKEARNEKTVEKAVNEVSSIQGKKPENGDNEQSSDDSLFDTGDSNVKPRKIRQQLGSSEDNTDQSDDQDEIVQKYKDKLSKFKEVSDEESAKEKSSDSNFSDEKESSNSSSTESENSNSSAADIKTSKRRKTDTKGLKSGNKVDSGSNCSDDNSNSSAAENFGKKTSRKSNTARKSKNDLSNGEEPDDSEGKTGDKTKKKRKRRKKKNVSGSDSDSEEDTQKKKNKRGKRKKIRKIMNQNQLQKETIAAQEEEDKRRQKIKEKILPSQQGKILNFILEDLRKEKDRSKPPTIDDEEKGKIIEVHSHLKKRLKPHQLDGIQFMYDCCIQSVEKVKSGSPGSGCILAHCMGLGKTFQVITFVTTILNYHYIFGLKRALVVCPLNTIRNWKVEFDKWLKDLDDAPEVHILTDNMTSNERRAEVVDEWYTASGVLIIGYSMYRTLSQGTHIRKKSLKELFKKCLVEPGPDIVICDEGHIIKNEKTSISKSLNAIQTKRRVILTGTPLQNNLVEYHCMVSFVKPSLLGTTKEFKNMYENPINNGQCVDATEFDIKIMKERSHILYEQLSGCVQRRDYNVLKEFLPKKFEYVLSIKLSDLQVKLYQKFLDRVKSNGTAMSRLFECYQTLKKVWTHPWLLEIDAMKNEKDSIDDFVTDKETSEESWDPSSEDSDFGSRKKKKKKKPSKKNKEVEKVETPADTADAQSTVNGDDDKMVKDIADTIIPDVGVFDSNWFKGDISEKDEKMLEHSGKLLVTLEILDKASQKGDKVLLFSQSLLALDFLETSINRVGWIKGRDYFRMDGSTKTAHRQNFQKQFNHKSNKRCRLFLISTRAGGLGINLVSANRIILFDMSWNPSDDTQSLFRAYRYGQTKDVYVYRLVARGTMEEKIYDRQVFKESLSSRVVDEKQISRYFSANDLQELFAFDPSAQTCSTSVLANHNPPDDDVLASILVDLDPPLVLEYHEHDSLLEHRPEQQLTEEERKAAWENFKQDKERRDIVRAPMGQQSVFQRLAAHTQMYAGPVITPIYSNQQELILGGFSAEQIVSIQQQLDPVVQAGRLQVKALGGGRLHIQGLGPEQQQVFINSIKEQQMQQIQAAQIARVLPQQHIINQLPPAERAIFEQRLALLAQQQQHLVAQQQASSSTSSSTTVGAQSAPKPLTIRSEPSGAPITVPE